MTKPRVINLTAHEAAAFQRGATMLVREVKPQPPSAEEVKKLSGSDYGWMDCSDMKRPSEFRVVGPVWAVRQLAYPQFIKPPYQPGDLLIGREAWQIYDTDGLSIVGICYKASYSSFAAGSAETQGAVKWFDVSPEIADSSLKVVQHMEVMGESWRSAAVMPQWAARVRRIVESVSLKRCQDLTEGDIEAMKYDFREHNAKLWAESRFVWVTKVKEAT